MPKQLTIRGLPDEVAKRLTKLGQARGKSLNAMIVEILKRAVDVHERRARLDRYVTWTDADLADFNEALSAQRVSLADNAGGGSPLRSGLCQAESRRYTDPH